MTNISQSAGQVCRFFFLPPALFQVPKANLQEGSGTCGYFHLAGVQKGAGPQRRSEHLENADSAHVV